MPKSNGRRRGSIVLTNDPRIWRTVVSVRSPDGSYKQRWRTVHETKRDAGRALTQRLRELETGVAISTRLLTTGWLSQWLGHSEGQVKP